jgi:hypothetical protein
VRSRRLRREQWSQTVEAHGIGGFGRSFLIAFGGVALFMGVPILWMILTLPGRSDLTGQLPVVVLGLVLTVVCLPIVGALCATTDRGVEGGALVGLLAAVGMWAAAGTAASDGSGTQRVFADFVPTFVVLAVFAGVPFMLGFLARRRRLPGDTGD